MALIRTSGGSQAAVTSLFSLQASGGTAVSVTLTSSAKTMYLFSNVGRLYSNYLTIAVNNVNIDLSQYASALPEAPSATSYSNPGYFKIDYPVSVGDVIKITSTAGGTTEVVAFGN